MKAVKAVRFQYQPDQELVELFNAFRQMTNDAVRIAIKHRITSRFRLIKTVYDDLKRYQLHTHYILSACEVACAVIRNRKRRRTPYIQNPFLKLDNQTYKLEGGTLRIPVKPRQYIHIKLKMGEYQRKLLSDPNIKPGSVTINPRRVAIAVSKEIDPYEPRGLVAYDTNEASIDGAEIRDNELAFKSYDLSAVKTLKHTYYAKRKRIQERYCNDQRKSRQLQTKYRRNEKNRTEAVLHKVSKQIVDEAKEKKLGIVLEDLKGIRKGVNKKKRGTNPFNGRKQRISVNTKSMKRRLNMWSFRKLQNFIEYKANWEGVPVSYIDPRYTSRNCPVCGCTVEPNGHLTECRNCGLKLNRHLLASLNILKRKDDSLRFGLDSPPSEAVIRPLNKAVSRRREAQTSATPDN